MNIYRESTQNKNWIFSKPDLDLNQVSKFERGLKILAELSRDTTQQFIQQIKDEKDQNKDNKDRQQIKVHVNLKKIISPLEERDYILNYTDQIKNIINRKLFDSRRSLKTYALTFFRRFYIKKTAIDYDPDYLLCAALFLGCKVAQIHVNMEMMKDLCPFLRDKHTEKNIENILVMLEYEFFLINVINYDFYVFCPYKAMLGFIYQIKMSQISNKTLLFDENNLKIFETKCEAMIDQAFLTDLIFIISYSYLALSCIFLTAESFGISFDQIKSLLRLDIKFNYDNFINETLLMVRETLNNIKIISDEEFINNKKKIFKFLKNNPKYVEKIEKDREGLKTKMKQFSDMIDDKIMSSKLPTTPIKPNDKVFIEQKREREEAKLK